jgi:hypothetical protein
MMGSAGPRRLRACSVIIHLGRIADLRCKSEKLQPQVKKRTFSLGELATPLCQARQAQSCHLLWPQIEWEDPKKAD